MITFFSWMSISGLFFVAADPEERTTYKNITTRICSQRNTIPQTYYGKSTFNAMFRTTTFTFGEVIGDPRAEGLTFGVSDFSARRTGKASYTFISTTENLTRVMNFEVVTNFRNITISTTTGKLIVKQCSAFSSKLLEFGDGHIIDWLARKLSYWMLNDCENEVWDPICNGNQNYVLPKELFDVPSIRSFICFDGE